MGRMAGGGRMSELSHWSNHQTSFIILNTEGEQSRLDWWNGRLKPHQSRGLTCPDQINSATIQTMLSPLIKLLIFLPPRNAGKCFNKNASVIENFHLKIITIFLFNSDTRILIETETFPRRNFSQIFKIMATLRTILNVWMFVWNTFFVL